MFKIYNKKEFFGGFVRSVGTTAVELAIGSLYQKSFGYNPWMMGMDSAVDITSRAVKFELTRKDAKFMIGSYFITRVFKMTTNMKREGLDMMRSSMDPSQYPSQYWEKEDWTHPDYLNN